MAAQQSGPHRPERSNAQERLVQRIGTFAIKLIQAEINESIPPEVQGIIGKNIEFLLDDLAEVGSVEDFDRIFNRFIEGTEGTESSYRFLYKTQQIAKVVRGRLAELLEDDSEEGFIAEYQEYIGSRKQQIVTAESVQQVKTGGTKVKRFLRAIFVTLPKAVVSAIKKMGSGEDDNRMANHLQVNAGVSAGVIALHESGRYVLPQSVLSKIPGVTEIALFATGLSFAAYTIYVALLLAAAEGKTTRGVTALEVLSGALVTYAQIVPQATDAIQEVIEELKLCVQETGTVDVDDLLSIIREKARIVNTGFDVDITHEKVVENVSELQEACRAGLSDKSDMLIKGGGIFIQLIAALSAKTVIGRGFLSGVSATAVSAIQSAVYDLDKPYGEDGDMNLSIEPLESAQRHIAFTKRLYELERRITERLIEQKKMNTNIVNSFYQCFRDIFDPWYENNQFAQELAVEYRNSTMMNPRNIEREGNFKAMKSKESEVRQAVLKDLKTPVPKFLFGQEVVGHGVFDMQQEIAFRFDDTPEHQLALLEATQEKVMEAPDMSAEQKELAVAFIMQWMKLVNAERQGMEPVEKSESQEVENAATAISGEIIANIKPEEQEIEDASDAISTELIENIESGRATYVRTRLAGARRVEMQTANRDEDWLPGNEEKLDAIHEKVIEKLEAAAEEDADRRQLYEAVITDIRRVRAENPLIDEETTRARAEI